MIEHLTPAVRSAGHSRRIALAGTLAAMASATAMAAPQMLAPTPAAKDDTAAPAPAMTAVAPAVAASGGGSLTSLEAALERAQEEEREELERLALAALHRLPIEVKKLWPHPPTHG